MRSRSFWVILLFVLSIPAALFAQDTASITGTVTDPSGAAVPGAQVTVRIVERGLERTTTTNGSGDYLVAGLPVGHVDVVVSATGFRKYQAKDVVLQVAQKARVDVTLQVGATSEEVTVQGSQVAQVETQSSDLSGTVTGKEITQLELNGRNFTQLVTLVPGVSNQTGQDEGAVGVGGSVSFSINGGRTEYNNWEIDGGDTMDNGSNGTLNVYPSLESIAEFKVLTSNYGAQYGRNGSGTVEVETKSGTNQFHGNAYEFVRNDAFNARNYFESSVPPYKKNDFGYTVGGPIVKGKTFFFWSQEWRRERIPNDFNQLVPSAAERTGDFSDLCPNTQSGTPADMTDCPIDPNTGNPYAGNQIPFDPSDPNVAALLTMIPLPTTGNPGAEIYQDTVSQPTTWREELVRLDQNFSDKERLTFRYIHDSWETTNTVPLWTNAGSFPTIQNDFKGPGVSVVARMSSTFSPTLLNEFVFSYTTDHIVLNNKGNWQRTPDMTMGDLFPGNGYGILPGINLVDQGSAYGGGFGEDAGYIPNGPYNSNPTYTYRDNVSKIIGKHNLQFGVYIAAAQKNELGGELGAGGVPGYLTFDPSSSSTTTGNPFADMLLGYIASYGQQNQRLKYYNRYKIVEPYFQDDWHVTDRLTLNLGLRLSLFGTYRERYRSAFNFDPATYQSGITTVNPDGTVNDLTLSNGLPNGIVQCGAGGQPAGCMKGHLFNPAPRIGFAWDPRGNGKTAIRGGYGIFFEHGNGNETGTESLENSPPLAFAAQQNNIVGYPSIGAGSTTDYPLSVISIPNKITWPYVQQWHFDVQHEVLPNTVITLSYVGSKGTHLGRQTDINQLQPVALSQNPYKVGEAYGANDCGNTFDANGEPMNAMTPSGVPIPYGTQAAVDLGVANCGANPDLFRPYPGYSDIGRLENQASSTYHALQLAGRRNMGGLSLSLAYTYSHSIDDSSDRYDGSFVNAYNPSANRASSNFDQRHILNFSYVWDLPFFKKPGISNKVLGGWEFSGITEFQTGTPFSVTYPTDNAGVGNGIGSSSRPDIIGDPRAGVVQAHLDGFGPVFYNAAAFTDPRGLTFGDSGRNILRNPRQINFDMALFKNVPIRESMSFEFRAEAFNVFNHTEWGAIAGDSGSAAGNNSSGTNSFGSDGFLYTNFAHNPRILQLALKFIF